MNENSDVQPLQGLVSELIAFKAEYAAFKAENREFKRKYESDSIKTTRRLAALESKGGNNAAKGNPATWA